MGMKSRKITILLAFFFGYLGVHQFYLGNTKKGIFYIVFFLLFFWTIIPFLIGFIDFLIFLIMSEYDFDLRYNTEYAGIITKSNGPKVEYVTLYDPTTTEPVPFQEALRRVDLASTNQSRERQKRILVQKDKIIKQHRCSIHNKPIKYGYTFDHNVLGIEIIAKCCEKSSEELFRKIK